MSVPLPVAQKLDELTALVTRCPVDISVPDVASFLGMDAEGLRASIEGGSCPFGLGWQKTIKGYRGFKIPTVPFYLWYTQGVGFRN